MKYKNIIKIMLIILLFLLCIQGVYLIGYEHGAANIIKHTAQYEDICLSFRDSTFNNSMCYIGSGPVKYKVGDYMIFSGNSDDNSILGILSVRIFLGINDIERIE